MTPQYDIICSLIYLFFQDDGPSELHLAIKLCVSVVRAVAAVMGGSLSAKVKLLHLHVKYLLVDFCYASGNFRGDSRLHVTERSHS